MDSTKMASTTDFQLNSITAEGLRNRSDGQETSGNQVKDEDTLALAKSGKKQILAVKLHSNALAESILIRKATVRFCERCGICLHFDEHMGRRLDVS
jgi:hypothetical protein